MSWRFRSLALAGSMVLGTAHPLTADPPAVIDPDDVLIETVAEPWTGDLTGAVERGFVRIGTAHGPPFLSYHQGEQTGITVDLAAEFEKHLRQSLGAPAELLTVVLTPLPRDLMIDALLEGRVDILSANLTITDERAGRVAFSAPTLEDVAEIVVVGPAAPAVATADDLVATELHVRPSSSYWEHLTALNAAREAEGAKPLPVVAADENLEDYDLLELVDVGVIPAVVVDSHKAAIYAEVFENLTLLEEVTIHQGGAIAWAMRPDAPEFEGAVNAFVEIARKGTELGNILFNRWLVDPERIRNAVAPGEDEKFEKTIGFIREHATDYGFEPLLIAAQGYQESRLEQSKRSDAGAVGIMQVMPATASDPNVDIPDIDTAERNVEAGVKYLRFIRDRYFSDPGIDEANRSLFAFAAYNAGPANIAKARKRAAELDLDPTIWFGHVEIAAEQVVGREPVIYVRNILKYYVTFRLFEAQRGGG